MSLSAALNNASTGLAASSLMAETISTNTANALTDGYARREVTLASRSTGGVTVVSVSRMIDEGVLREKWLSSAAAANAGTKTEFYTRMETDIGSSETPGSLPDLLSALNEALIAAAAAPDSSTTLETVVTAADALADKINAVSDDIQQARLEADRSIASQVSTLNDALQKIEDLNTAITRATATGADANALKDERQSLLDDIAEIVPIQTIARDGDQIAIYTTGGQALLDGSAATLAFTGAQVMTSSMTATNGLLSGLTINGVAIDTGDSGAIGGGSLSAAFAVRDVLAVGYQTELDAIARDIVERFSDSGVDPTLSSGQAGLFTDAGSAFDANDESGLAGRISINALIDSSQGGASWRLRDGLGATSQGEVSSSTILSAMVDALEGNRAISSGAYAGATTDAASLVSELLSRASSARLSAEETESYATTRLDAATDAVLAQGVDSDYELQLLLIVEQAYAANARVIEAIDAMMQTILEL